MKPHQLAPLRRFVEVVQRRRLLETRVEELGKRGQRLDATVRVRVGERAEKLGVRRGELHERAGEAQPHRAIRYALDV